MPCAALTNPHRDASSRMHVGIHVKLKSCCYCKCSVFIINSNRPDESRERLKLFILSFTYLHSVHTHWLFRFHSRVAACGPAGPDIRETSGHWVSPGHMLPSAAAEDRWRSASFCFFFFFCQVTQNKKNMSEMRVVENEKTNFNRVCKEGRWLIINGDKKTDKSQEFIRIKR